MNTFSVLRPALRREARIIVISDIHGNLAYFRGLLDKLRLREDDQLILLGDIVEKGPHSLETLRYTMALSERYAVYPVLGNCDFWHLWVDGEITDAAWDAHTVEHLLHQKETGRCGLILEMCREAGLPFTGQEELPALKKALLDRFGPEFSYLREMPFALDTKDYLFVHGGVPRGMTLEEAGAWGCMKLDRFYDSRPRMDKWTVVGHTPVCLYSENTIAAAPIIDRECRLISIDGGCVLKDDGQLNALIIENGQFSVDWYDPFPLIRASEPQRESERSTYIRWGDNAVTLLAQDGDFCRIRHDRTGYELSVPADFLYYKRGRLLVTDATDYRPAVEVGDVLSLVRETDHGAWVKKNGVTGWYGGKYKLL